MTVVDAPWEKELEVEIVVPVENMTRPEETAPAVGPADEPGRKSIWPAVYPQLLDLVLSHTSTLLFVNSRGLAERLAAEINRLADSAALHQARRLVAQEPNRLPAYTVEIDILQNLKRIYYFAKRIARMVVPSEIRLQAT